MPPPALDPVGRTSRWVAAARAAESARPDRLFDDPYAALLAGSDGETCLKVIGPQAAPVVGYLALRTKCLDDAILAGVSAGIRQCVILAAGMDTRAFRLAWHPDTQVFEVDRPAVLAVKDGLLKKAGAEPHCLRRTIGADLTGDWVPALQGAGFDVQQPTIWLIEGLLMYLEAEAVRNLLATVSGLAAPGSRLGADVPDPPPPMALDRLPPLDRQLAQRFGTTDPAGLVAVHGWRAAVTTPGEVALAVGRAVPPPMTRPDGQPIRNWLVTGER
jgi:methyltransferase (TIGR00027 family)